MDFASLGNRPGNRKYVVEGFDQNGLYVKVVIPVHGDLSISADKTMTLENGTLIQFSGTDASGNIDEIGESMARLTEQTNKFFDAFSHYDTMPEGIVVPKEYVPYLYTHARTQVEMAQMAKSLKGRHPYLPVTMQYTNSQGITKNIENFNLPTGMLATEHRYVTVNGQPLLELHISLIRDVNKGDTLSAEDLAFIRSQLPSDFGISTTITIFIAPDNFASSPTDQLNPISSTPTINYLPTATPTPSSTPTATPIPEEAYYPSGDEINEMDPLSRRVFRRFGTATPQAEQ
jgi:hypothetical protein